MLAMATPPTPPLGSQPPIRLTPAFKLAFLTVTGLTVLSLIVAIWLAQVPNSSDDTRRIIETCTTTYKMGFGAIVGLIGGKAL